MRPKCLVSILVLLALALPVSTAHAGGIVSVCDEAHLLTELVGGGMVTFSCSGIITLTAPVTIAANTTIDGSGQVVTISGNHAVRVFTVEAMLTLNEVIVANGSVADLGGGIYNNSGTVTVSNSTFSGNRASHGGGIYNSGGTVTVSNSTFSSNSASWTGGGIDNTSGTVTVSSSTFVGNSGWYGGGIYNYYFGTLTVRNSTFSNNTAGAGGGFDNDGGTVTVSNGTFFGNSANYYGGGINSNSGTVSVSNSTFSGNGAAYGGGIYNDYPGTLTQRNTIVANSLTGNNCSGTITDGGGNLSYPDTTCPGIHGDPLLGPLQNNVGPTETMTLGPGSAAIDSASDAICAAAPVNNLDQRGIARPWGTRCDIGAVEQVPLKRLWLPAARSR